MGTRQPKHISVTAESESDPLETLVHLGEAMSGAVSPATAFQNTLHIGATACQPDQLAEAVVHEIGRTQQHGDLQHLVALGEHPRRRRG